MKWWKSSAKFSNCRHNRKQCRNIKLERFLSVSSKKVFKNAIKRMWNVYGNVLKGRLIKNFFYSIHSSLEEFFHTQILRSKLATSFKANTHMQKKSDPSCSEQKKHTANTIIQINGDHQWEIFHLKIFLNKKRWKMCIYIKMKLNKLMKVWSALRHLESATTLSAKWISKRIFRVSLKAS